MIPIIDPNITYVLLVVGFILSILAILTPGTGIIEIAGLFSLVVAGYGVISNPTNLWALIFLIPWLPFLIIFRKNKQNIYLILSILFLNLGSFMIFKGETGIFAVSPFLGLIVFTINAPIVWLVLKKVSEAIDREPDFNPVKIVNMDGVARTNIAPEGTVYVNGEEWSARSDHKILIGSKIKVMEKEGLVLIVEELD